MSLKKNILFLCVTFYFVQCQGAPSEDEIALIKSRVPELLGQDELITFDRIETVVWEIAGALGKSYKTDVIEKWEKIQYSKEEVITNVLAFIAANDRRARERVNTLLKRHIGRNDTINADGLISILLELQDQAIFHPRPFPTTILGYINEEKRRTANNRLYTLDDVKTYALAFLSSGDVALNNMVLIMYRNLYGTSKTMEYEDYINMIESVKSVIIIEKPIPSRGLFEAEILRCKLSVNGVENMIIEKFHHLFP